MVQIYYSNIKEQLQTMTEDQRQLMLSLVCVERREKVNQIRITSKQDSTLLAGVMVESIIRDYASAHEISLSKELPFTYGDNGKPHLTNENSLHFNLSHSGDYVVVAIGDTPVGIDVQVQEPKMDYMAIASRCFHPKEYDYLCTIRDESRRKETFFSIWSQKEAYVKCIGDGLTLGFQSFSVDEETSSVREDDSVTLKSFFVEDNYFAAICTKGKKVPLGEIQEFQW